MPEGELAGIRATAGESIQQRRDVRRLEAEARQQREIDVLGQAGFAPALYREATDEAEARGRRSGSPARRRRSGSRSRAPVEQLLLPDEA